MIFRNAHEADLPLIVEIYNSTIPGRLVTADTSEVTVADKRDWFFRHNPESRPLWMVEDEGRVIGWAGFQSFYGRPAYNGTAEISIYLKPRERGHGYGKKILMHAIEQCPKLGIRNLLGFIFAHNTASLRLFEQAGFSEWGHLPDVAVMDGKAYSLKILGLTIQPPSGQV
ncbi:MAG TPA: N-acetyltransferase [Chitinophagaceae bacterium]|nr:N-acetyltransferase [Chitinophagaceae bacterium]